MDPVLSSLFPINKIGSDGFSWWIGQVENTNDPKKGGRVQIRIVGEHLRDCSVVPTASLPWAPIMMPVTTPYSDNGDTGASSNLATGSWVLGFYLDNDKQKPIIMGSIPHTPGSTKVVGDDPNPGGDCKSLTRYVAEADPYTNFSQVDGGPTASADNEVGYEAGAVTTGAQPVASQRAGERGGAPPVIAGAFGKNSENNPTGGQFCVVIANPHCGAEKNLKTNLTHIIGEMLAANQDSGGQLGDFYVSKVSGVLTEQVGTGRYHISRVVRLVRSSVARAKGEVLKTLREGIDTVVETALYERERPIVPDDIDQPLTEQQRSAVQEGSDALSAALESGDQAEIDAANASFAATLEEVTGQRGHPTIKPKQSRLKGLQDFFNNAVKDLGCSFKDITERLAQFITDLLLGLLEQAYNAAACLIDQVVNYILSTLLGFIDEIINAVLGPIQEILSAIASVGNMVGAAIKKVTDLLGLVCTGPEAQCEKIQVTCTDCSNGEESEDDLDRLIRAVEDGALDFGSGICREATEYPPVPETSVVFLGGTPAPTTPPVVPGPPSGPVPPFGVGVSGRLEYTSSNIRVPEGSPAVFTITRSGDITQPSSLNFTFNNITTTAADYTLVSPAAAGAVAFAAGATSATITFNTIADAVVEGFEEFSIVLSVGTTPPGYINVFPSGVQFDCTIIDPAVAAPVIPAVPGIPAAPPPAAPVVPVLPVAGPFVPAIPAVALAYAVSPDKAFVDEGDTVTFNIVTKGVPDGASLNYTLSGINSADIVGGSLTGSFVITSGAASVPIQIAVNDDAPGDDPAEALTFSIDTTTASASVTINATRSTAPSYFISADKTVANEGDTIIYTVKTTNVADGTVLTYSLSGPSISSTDIVGGLLTGNVTITSSIGTFSIQVANDGIFEGPEVLTCSINTTTASVDVIINNAPLAAVPVALTPTYAVSSDKLIYDEGETIVYTITTTNVSDGTNFSYQLFGSGITASDFISRSLSGTFTIYSNTATVNIQIEDDTDIEGDETLRFSIITTAAFTDVIIRADVPASLPTTGVFKRCIGTPRASVTTDSSGRIISIDLDDPGCPYATPPRVIITGVGYGAAAIVTLDKTGYVSGVKLTRTGVGYTPALPPTGTLCIVTSFTLIRPGSGYTSIPTVYVDDDDSIAEAIIKDGFVTEIRVLNRTRSFDILPKVRIVGGGGYGARFLPNLSCLDSDELTRRGYAKIGTGKYIDCP